jgi:hypothetical protein
MGDCDEIYLFLECFVSIAPVLIFFCTGCYNFNEIRSIGFNRVVQYSTLFKWKYRACLFMVLINIAFSILPLFDDREYPMLMKCVDFFTEKNEERIIVILIMFFRNFLFVIGWLGSYRLLIY